MTSYHVSMPTPYMFTVNEFPVDYTSYPQRRCTDVSYSDAALSSKFQFTNGITTLPIPISISELALRSVVVYGDDGNAIACGTILPDERLVDATILRARFSNEVGGTLYFTQAEGKTAAVYAKLV